MRILKKGFVPSWKAFSSFISSKGRVRCIYSVFLMIWRVSSDFFYSFHLILLILPHSSLKIGKQTEFELNIQRVKGRPTRELKLERTPLDSRLKSSKFLCSLLLWIQFSGFEWRLILEMFCLKGKWRLGESNVKQRERSWSGNITSLCSFKK